MRKIILLVVLLSVSYTFVFSQEIKSVDSNKVEIIDQNAKKALDSNRIAWEQTLIKADDFADDFALDSTSCDAQWAYEVSNVSSEFDKEEKSGKMALGKPNVLPVGGEAYTAWAVKHNNGKEEEGIANIKVKYQKPARINQVAIGESFNPGAVTKVVIYGTEGEKEEIYKAEPQKVDVKAQMLNIFLDKPTEFYVEEVEVFMNPVMVPGLNQIDAIGIGLCDDSIKASINFVPNIKFGSSPENFGPAINTIYDEVAPMISPDGKTLYFDRKNHPENAGGFEDVDDIWYSVQDPKTGKWRPAKNIGEPLNNKYNNYVQSITPDGNQLLLGNEYDKYGPMKPGVSLTYRTRQGWAFPETQKIKGFYNKNQYANYFLSNDGKVLLMAIEQKNSYGQLDLYVSFREGQNNWTEPQNLGKSVNTSVNDYSPFLAADGVTLYFSSAGFAGFGMDDIFVTTRLDDTWKNWTEPQNLGPIINSAEKDAKYNIPASGEYAYFSSTNNSKGKNDIFRIALPKKVKPKPVVLISGKVLNERTNKPVDASIIVEELPGGKEVAIARTDPNTGEFKIVLPAGKKYGFRAIGLGFFESNKNIDLTDVNEYKEIEEEFLRLSPIEVGQVVRLNNIFFDYGKATLKPESFPELDRTVEFLNNNSKIEIEVAGHTDNKGSDEYNLKLSQSRAESVANYLIEHGVDEDRITAKGYGETRPIAFNNNDEGRAKNRRVEFKVLKTD